MSGEKQIKAKNRAYLVRPDKWDRIKNVRRGLSALEDRDISDVGLIDEILEEGLASRENKLSVLKMFQK